MKPLISVIIPFYNVESYIAEALDSIVNQTVEIELIEVILVNDCSTDDSLKIALSYVEKYPTIRIIHQQRNQGTGPARNIGLKNAEADYVTFLDADDFVSTNMVEHALDCFDKHNCDLVLYEYEYYSKSGKAYSRNPSGKLFLQNRVVTDITEAPEIIFATSVCNKVFRKALLDDIVFPQSQMEDVMFSTLSTFRVDRIKITNCCKYYYRKREQTNQISKTDSYYTNKHNYLDHLETNIQMYALIEEYPNYKEIIDWFNARSLQPFLYHIVLSQEFSLLEKKDYYEKAQRVLTKVSLETVARLEQPLARYIIAKAKKHSFYYFISCILTRRVSDRLKNMFSTKGSYFKLLEICFVIILSILYRFNPRYRELWLVCERGDEAKDNGYAFFKYLREDHQEKNVYYLIDPKHELDYSKVAVLGNVVPYRSLKHKIMFVLAKKLITAHNGTVEPWNYRKFNKWFSKLLGKKDYIFLQHGITKDDVSNVLGKANTMFDLFITGGKPEYEYILNTFGYREQEVAYTGFARFDYLRTEHKNKKTILLMPTWRKNITWVPTEQNKRAVFINSLYYKSFQSLINNQALNEWLEATDYQLIFYPHYEVQQYLDLFSSQSSRVLIASKDRFDVQDLLKQSSLLITDYSSVFFDFAYMEKPVLYYQFDKNDFFDSHYQKGYFNYETDGFGPVITQEDVLVDLIKASYFNQFVVEDVYKHRVDLFFEKRDDKNCERIYEAIKKL